MLIILGIHQYESSIDAYPSLTPEFLWILEQILTTSPRLKPGMMANHELRQLIPSLTLDQWEFQDPTDGLVRWYHILGHTLEVYLLT